MPNVLRYLLLLAHPALLVLSRARSHLPRNLHHSLLPLLTRPRLPPKRLRNPHRRCAPPLDVCDGIYIEAKLETE